MSTDSESEVPAGGASPQPTGVTAPKKAVDAVIEYLKARLGDRFRDITEDVLAGREEIAPAIILTGLGRDRHESDSCEAPSAS